MAGTSVYTQGLTSACRVRTYTLSVLSTQPPMGRMPHEPAQAPRPAACITKLRLSQALRTPAPPRTGRSAQARVDPSGAGWGQWEAGRGPQAWLGGAGWLCATQAGAGAPGPLVLAGGHLTLSYLALFLRIFSTAQGFQDGPVHHHL